MWLSIDSGSSAAACFCPCEEFDPGAQLAEPDQIMKPGIMEGALPSNVNRMTSILDINHLRNPELSGVVEVWVGCRSASFFRHSERRTTVFVSPCLWSSPPNLFLACMTNRTCEEERSAPSQPSRGCFRWRGHPYRLVYSVKEARQSVSPLFDWQPNENGSGRQKRESRTFCVPFLDVCRVVFAIVLHLFNAELSRSHIMTCEQYLQSPVDPVWSHRSGELMLYTVG
ncbi:hypothetical protein EXN66_Car012082 [Channa argus]|uniref:Uncharacterized protein n=1 Tax=Channa argus TaxID=215402 RepID=A0A6G1Q1Y7_CHAAH|nr:hypothetical protein EXN66_Car012082 [Channa argus]